MLKAKVVGQRAAEKLGDAMQEVRRERQKRLNVDLPMSLHLALKARAAKEGVGMSHLVRLWVEEYLSKSPDTHSEGGK